MAKKIAKDSVENPTEKKIAAKKPATKTTKQKLNITPDIFSALHEHFGFEQFKASRKKQFTAYLQAEIHLLLCQLAAVKAYATNCRL